MDVPDVTHWTHQFDASTATCLVFVLKEGVLSAVAHDLKLRFEEFEVAVDEPTRSIAAIFNADSARVITAMRDGQDDPQALSSEQKTQIELNIRLDVLRSREFPDIVFVSDGVSDSEAGFVVRGRVEIQQKAQAITFPVQQVDGAYVADARVHQPDFGIQPYSALMGAIRVRPTVVVRVSLPMR